MAVDSCSTQSHDAPDDALDRSARDAHVRVALIGMRGACSARDVQQFVAHVGDLLATPGDAMYPSFRELMENRAAAVLGSSTDADDAASNAGLRVVAAAMRTFETQVGSTGGHLDIERLLAHPDPAAAVGKFMHTTVTWIALDVLRSRKRVDPWTDALDEMPDDHAARTAGAAVARLDLTAALTSIPPELASVITLHYVEGLTQAEVAERLGCSRPTVSGRLSRARLALAVKLGDDYR